MAPPKMSASDREREAREDAVRRRRLSVRLGALGIAVLFLGGAGTILSPDYVVPMLGVMVVGIVLIVAGLFAIQGALRELRSLAKLL